MNFIVNIKGQDYVLTRREFALWTLLDEKRGKIVTNTVLKIEMDCSTSSLRVLAHKLQEKIADSETIHSKYGIGYFVS